MERIHASATTHLDGLIAAAQTPEFWHRTIGNALEASVYSAAIAAVDQLLVHLHILPGLRSGLISLPLLLTLSLPLSHSPAHRGLQLHPA